MLVRNAIQTPDGTILESHHQHDFVSYVDKNGHTYAADGGKVYLRRMGPRDYKDLSVSEDAPFSEIRAAFSWGTYGKNGNEPLTYILLKDMEADHIYAILNRNESGEQVLNKTIKEWFQKELIFRNQ